MRLSKVLLLLLIDLQFVAPVLDVVYISEEKEKVVPLVTNIMYYVTPYLRNHRLVVVHYVNNES